MRYYRLEDSVKQKPFARQLRRVRKIHAAIEAIGSSPIASSSIHTNKSRR
jgi:hypothetical protein